MKKRLNRMLSTLLICSMVMTLMPTTVFATNRKDAVMEEYAGGLCEHHPEHDDDCGFCFMPKTFFRVAGRIDRAWTEDWCRCKMPA